MQLLGAVVIGVAVLAGAAFLIWRAENPAKAEDLCTAKTLKGTYVYAQDGFNVQGDAATQRTPFAQAGREFFDGKGKMSGVATASLNGTIARSTYSGTYAIKSDCTGTVTFTDNLNQTFHYDIFIGEDRKEFVFIQTDAGVVTAAFERRK